MPCFAQLTEWSVVGVQITQEAAWYFPDGHEILPGFLAVSDIYQNRGPQIVRLNRRNGVQSPSGKYRCEIPDANGTTKLFVTIMPSTGI